MNTPETLLDLCRRALDPDATVIGYHDGHEGTRVLRAATRAGQAIVKLHRDRERHEREVFAYRHWTPCLGYRAPTPLAVVDDPPAIILTALAGQPLAAAALAPAAERVAYWQAGAILRDFHSAARPTIEPDMIDWLVERGEAWLTAACDILSSSERTEIQAHLHALRDLAPIPAVPCHLDFTPRNLLHAADGTVGVVDFEHARYDIAARDLVRLATRTWTDRRDLKEAFLSEYGQLTDLDDQVIEHCRHLDQLTRTARQHGRTVHPARPTDAVLARPAVGRTRDGRRDCRPEPL